MSSPVAGSDPTFGQWTQNLKPFTEEFKDAKPFQHTVIPNFLNEQLYKEIVANFPKQSDAAWNIYHNPIEKKYAMNNFKEHPLFAQVFKELQSDRFVEIVRSISGIEDAVNDPHLHGAGLHFHPRGGKLDMHLDYSIHPISKKERRLNLILYLNDSWDDAWGGHLELWDKDFTKCEKRVSPQANMAVLFRTSDISYHGLPKPISCPEGNGRKSIAIYYVSEPRENVVHRYKAQFRPLPDQPVNDKLAALYRIRETRLITKEDLAQQYPEWETDGNGHW